MSNGSIGSAYMKTASFLFWIGVSVTISISFSVAQTIDDEMHLRRCPVCGCRELFVRKDFPQVTGFLIVVLAAVLSIVLFGIRAVKWGFAVLGVVALIDAMIFLFAGKCLVCYRCRSEFRGLDIRKDHPGWELAIGEKYRRAQNH